MGFFWAFSWILIPIAFILAGAFKEWLKFQEKQHQLGTSTAHLEQEVSELKALIERSERNREALLRRIQNLETIVTSQVWDVLNDPEIPAEERKLEIDAVKPRIELPPPEDEASQKVEQLARRLRA